MSFRPPFGREARAAVATDLGLEAMTNDGLRAEALRHVPAPARWLGENLVGATCVFPEGYYWITRPGSIDGKLLGPYRYSVRPGRSERLGEADTWREAVIAFIAGRELWRRYDNECRGVGREVGA